LAQQHVLWHQTRTTRADVAMLPLTIISGGQSGVDRAALDVAIALGLPEGGWCPRGRRAEDGPLHPRYQLRETEGDGYRQRTRRNVADSDATLVLNEGSLTGGTALTVDFAVRLSKPHLVLHLDHADDWNGAAQGRFADWLTEFQVGVLNVAGPGERKRPGIYGRAVGALRVLLAADVGASKEPGDIWQPAPGASR